MIFLIIDDVSRTAFLSLAKNITRNFIDSTKNTKQTLTVKSIKRSSYKKIESNYDNSLISWKCPLYTCWCNQNIFLSMISRKIKK